jgi:glucan phosphoethanolaminetransferase (alkaline phosphatase superfamily)
MGQCEHSAKVISTRKTGSWRCSHLCVLVVVVLLLLLLSSIPSRPLPRVALLRLMSLTSTYSASAMNLFSIDCAYA